MGLRFTTNDLESPVGIERVLRQIEQVLYGKTGMSSSSSGGTAAAASIPSGISRQTAGGGGSAVILDYKLPFIDTHAARLGSFYNPSNFDAGRMFFERDRTVLYIDELVSGALVWRFVGGEYVSTFANRPSDLGTNDSSFQFYATDQDTTYIWTGAAWNTTTRRILIGGFFAIFTHANTADRTYLLPDATGNITYETAPLVLNNVLTGGGLALVQDSGIALTAIPTTVVVDLTAQVATVGPTTLIAAGSQFLFSYSLFITTLDVGLATVTVSVNYTDDIGATSQAGAALAVTATNRQTGTFVIRRASGNVTYTATVTGVIGTAVFALHATLERYS